MHNILFLQRRFPNRAGLVVGILLGLSVSALVAGVGLLLLT